MGGAEVVRTLAAWAEFVGLPLCLNTRWGGGLTALHVATLLREPEAVALALTGAQRRQRWWQRQQQRQRQHQRQRWRACLGVPSRCFCFLSQLGVEA